MTIVTTVDQMLRPSDKGSGCKYPKAPQWYVIPIFLVLVMILLSVKEYLPSGNNEFFKRSGPLEENNFARHATFEERKGC